MGSTARVSSAHGPNAPLTTDRQGPLRLWLDHNKDINPPACRQASSAVSCSSVTTDTSLDAHAAAFILQYIRPDCISCTTSSSACVLAPHYYTSLGDMDFDVATQVPGGFSSYDAFDQHSNWFAANNDPLAFNFDATAATLDFNPYDYTASNPLPAMPYPCLPHDQQHIAAARVRSDCSSPRTLPPNSEPSMTKKPSHVPRSLLQVTCSVPSCVPERKADNLPTAAI
jgi:hypothetical protein